MTTAGLEATGSPEEHSTGSGLYHISIARLERSNRSAVHLIAGRLTEDCPSYGRPPQELNAVELMGEIKEFHGDTEDFIRSDMPIKEIAFRTLLTRGNEPLALGELHRELTGRWSNPLRPISIEQSLLARVLETDTYYGFAQA